MEDRSPPESLIILREEVTPDTFSQEELDLIKKCNAVTCTYPVFIGFDHRPVEWLLAQYLPHIPNIVNSFETVGHIAHMNLRGEEMIQAKYTIGAIVLEVR